MLLKDFFREARQQCCFWARGLWILCDSLSILIDTFLNITSHNRTTKIYISVELSRLRTLESPDSWIYVTETLPGFSSEKGLSTRQHSSKLHQACFLPLQQQQTLSSFYFLYIFDNLATHISIFKEILLDYCSSSRLKFCLISIIGFALNVSSIYHMKIISIVRTFWLYKDIFKIFQPQKTKLNR